MKRNPIIEEDLKYITGTKYVPWKKLEGKTILISGANGFLPSYLVETILYLNETKFKRKAKVIALVRNKKKALARFACYQGRTDLELLITDVCSKTALKQDVNYIIHAASKASPKYFGSDPVGTLTANVVGTMNMLELARAKGVEGFLFFSSGEVYGEVSSEQTPILENYYGYIDPLNVRSCYAESKKMAENMCICWHNQHSVPVKIVRPFHTYGPGMHLDDRRVYADFMSNMVNGQDIIMKSDGRAVRTFCYIADATAGFFTVLLKGSNGEAYNVSDSKGTISILQLAKLLARINPAKKLKIIRSNKKSKGGYIQSRISKHRPDMHKIEQLGWRPKYSLAKGFLRTLESFKYALT